MNSNPVVWKRNIGYLMPHILKSLWNIMKKLPLWGSAIILECLQTRDIFCRVLKKGILKNRKCYDEFMPVLFVVLFLSSCLF